MQLLNLSASCGGVRCIRPSYTTDLHLYLLRD
jgi:hypothetical protein